MRPLDRFSRLLTEKYGNPHALSPEGMAEEWVTGTGLSALPSLSEIHRKLESYGLSLQQGATPGLRGHHYCYRGGDPTIVYEDTDWRGAVEFTLLHEFYEVILDRLTGILPCHEPLSPSEACWRANRFAAAVLMQKDIFLQALHESNFDIVWLHRHFYRSYSAVAIRAVRLLSEVTGPRRKEFGCAIYQRSGDPRQWGNGQPADFHVGCAVYTPSLRLERRRYPTHFIPNKEDGVLPGSIAEMALKTNRPVLLRKAAPFDVAKGKGLTLLARPVCWFGKLSKVVLHVTALEDSHILESQAKQLNPRVMM